MMTKKIILLSVIIMMIALPSQGEDFFEDISLSARVGYSIGGTAPIIMPASIRKLNSFDLQQNITLGLDAHKRFDGKWGAILGLYLDDKGMRTDAQVKNYHTSIERDGSEISGMFTGDVLAHTRQWMINVPILATYSISNKVDLLGGAYLAYVFSRTFNGYVHDGYMRVGDPTGARIDFGHNIGERGEYNFSKDMRRFQYGLKVGADWHFSRLLGAYADISWGLNGIAQSKFKTIEQTLYPIYGTVGLTYKLK